MKFLISLLFTLAAATPVVAQEYIYPETDEELEAAFAALNVENGGQEFKLEASNSSLAVPEQQLFLIGEDAIRFNFLNQGAVDQDIEAIMFDPQTFEQVIFYFLPEGYVRDDDWEELDPDHLISSIRENTEAANEERMEKGIEPITNVRWHTTPTYDRGKRTALWIIEADDGPTKTVNAVALRLGREGFFRITWVIGNEPSGEPNEKLQAVLNGHAFSPGYRYADFVDGDKIAAFGLASLVAASAGSKSTKGFVAVLIATLVAFAKKAWILVFVAAAAAWAGIKRLFNNNKDPLE